MARPPNTDARRAQIVRGLMRVMADRGYERATIQSIAEAAGISPGLVHYHFENKQQILVAVAEEFEAIVERRLEQTKGAETSRATLIEYLEAYVALGDGADREAVACWVALGAEALRTSEVREVYQRTMGAAAQMMDEVVFDALREEGRDTAAHHEIITALLVAIEGTFQVAALLPEMIRPGSAAPMLRAIANGLLDAQPPRPRPRASTKARRA